MVEQAVATEVATSVEDIMSEAEKRFAKAKYYEILIKQPIFDSDDSGNAVDVTKEIQDFARDRLTVLLGLKSEAKIAESVFSDEEVLVLKKLVAKLLKKPDIAGMQPAEPVLRKAQGPKGPVLSKPTVAKPQAPKTVAAPKAPPPVRQGLQETGETIKIPQKDGSSREYRKVLGPSKEVWYLGANGQRYSLEQNEAGEYYMKSLWKQSRPANAPAGAPRLTSDMMAVVAAQQAASALRQDPVASRGVSGFLTE
jgi:hypothetical protein